MSHIIEDVQSVATARNPEPLNGLEARAYILNELRKWLEGQHHLFSIGKAYARGACGFSITIALEGEVLLSELKSLVAKISREKSKNP